VNKARIKLPIAILTLGVSLVGFPWLPFVIDLLQKTSANVTWLDKSLSLIATMVGLGLILWGVRLTDKHLVRIEKNADEKTNS